jgi:hypothetical protein
MLKAYVVNKLLLSSSVVSLTATLCNSTQHCVSVIIEFGEFFFRRDKEPQRHKDAKFHKENRFCAGVYPDEGRMSLWLKRSSA